MDKISTERLEQIIEWAGPYGVDAQELARVHEVAAMATELLASRKVAQEPAVRPYLSDIAMRIAVTMEAHAALSTTTAAKADAICDILASITPPSQEPKGDAHGEVEISYEHAPSEIAAIYGADIIDRMRIQPKWHDYIRLTVEQAIDYDRSKSRAALNPQKETAGVAAKMAIDHAMQVLNIVTLAGTSIAEGHDGNHSSYTPLAEQAKTAWSGLAALSAPQQQKREAASQPVTELLDYATFAEWLRPWVKRRFGQWITHNTTKGAYTALTAALQPQGE